MLRDGMPVDVSNRATMENRTDVIKHLLHEGADANQQAGYIKYTPLHDAARRNYTEVARMLINNGADVNLISKDNKTPLDLAVTGSEVEHLLLRFQQSVP